MAIFQQRNMSTRIRWTVAAPLLAALPGMAGTTSASADEGVA